MRAMSCFLTQEQVIAHEKFETRRNPSTWRTLEPGDMLKLVNKGQGLKRGERQIILAIVCVTHNTLEPLDAITQEDVIAEGFPDWTPAEFIAFYYREKGGEPGQMVRVVRWDYMEERPS